MWKGFFYFSKYEKQGIILLIVLLFLSVGANIYFSTYTFPVEIYDYEESTDEYNAFISSIKEIESLKNTKQNYTYTKTENTHGSNKRSKFADYQTDNSPKGKTELTNENKKTTYTKQFKYPVGTVICLNSADTTELMKIPGIGTARAGMILNYRKKLGGFIATDQLKEIERLNSVVDTLLHRFCITDSTIQRINLNTAGIERLRAHPYINFYQAKVIVEHRKKKGDLKNIDQLRLYEEFDEEGLKRISPYVSFK